MSAPMSKAEAALLQRRGLERRFVEAVLKRLGAGADDMLGLVPGHAARVIERRSEINSKLLVALYGGAGRKLRPDLLGAALSSVLDAPVGRADSATECLAGGAGLVPAQGAPHSQTGEAVSPAASPTQTPAVDAGVATAPPTPAAAGEGAACANAPPPKPSAVAFAQAELRRDRDEWRQVWEDATATARAASERVDRIDRALAALDGLAA